MTVDDLAQEIRRLNGNQTLGAGALAEALMPFLLARHQAECASLLARAERAEKLDREAATHVESVICLRTRFTGEAPYVGWKGLGLALREELDELDALRSRVSDALEALRPFADAAASYDPEEGDGDSVAWAHHFKLASLRRAREVRRAGVALVQS